MIYNSDDICINFPAEDAYLPYSNKPSCKNPSEDAWGYLFQNECSYYLKSILQSDQPLSSQTLLKTYSLLTIGCVAQRSKKWTVHMNFEIIKNQTREHRGAVPCKYTYFKKKYYSLLHEMG